MDISLKESMKKDYDGYLLMKFFKKKEYMQEFLRGELFFNTSDYFMFLEEKGQGDRFEGMKYVSADVNNSRLIIINPKDLQSGNKDFIKVGGYSPKENRCRKILCFYALYCNLKENKLFLPHSEMAKEFGEYVVVFPYRNVLFDGIINSIQKDVSIKEASIGFVDYISADDIGSGMKWNAFKKLETFSYQNELRVTFIDGDREPRKVRIEKSIIDKSGAIAMLAEDLHKIKLEENVLKINI